jgi:transcriptional regulator with XRE-family HTH domain
MSFLGVIMFINKTDDGRNNLCGKNVTKLRNNLGISQRILANKLQILGLDVDKNAIQRIEAGKRFVTDIELFYLCKVFDVTYDELLSIEP